MMFYVIDYWALTIFFRVPRELGSTDRLYLKVPLRYLNPRIAYPSWPSSQSRRGHNSTIRVLYP